MSFGHDRLGVYRAAIEYVGCLEVCGALSAEDNVRAKRVLDRIVAMLTKLGRRGYTVAEELVGYAEVGIDSDSDPDSDPEGAAGIRSDGHSGRQKPNNGVEPTRIKTRAAHAAR